MAGINFVILKINGIDVTDIPHEEAVQIFLKAPEPILVEVRRRLNDSQQHQQPIKKPSTPSHEISEKSKDQYSNNGGDLKTTITTTTTTTMPIENYDINTNMMTKTKFESSTSSKRSSDISLESSNNSNGTTTSNITTTNTTTTTTTIIQKQSENINNAGNNRNITENNKNYNDDGTIPNATNSSDSICYNNICSSNSIADDDNNTVNSSNSLCNKCYVSTAVQTDMFTSEFIFNNSSIDDQTNEDNIFEECLAPEIDIEEITLRKSVSNERLGLTVKYSSGNASSSDDTDTCTEVYISDIMPDSVAARDGRLRQGDQILQVNGRDVSNKEETESLIAENKNAVTLLVSRCLYPDDDFNESGEFYEDDEQHVAYENYAIEQQCTVDNRSLDNICLQEQTITNTSSTKSSASPKHHTTNTVVSKSHDQSNQQQQDELMSSVLSATDPLHHANIKAHLESVNHEIAMLNTRVENMMLHKKSHNEYLSNNQNLGSVYRIPLDCVTSPVIPLNENPANNKLHTHPKVSAVPVAIVDNEKTLKQQQQQHSRNRCFESDTEHIYETIPESSESEPFYCSPYESSDQNLVEKWLETQQDGTLERSNKKRILQQQQQTKSNKQKSSIWQKSSTKSNSSGDDRENSSSAYNTGGSCNSNNQLTLELNSNDDPRDRDIMRSTLTLCPPKKPEIENKQLFQQDVNDGSCKQCQRQKKDKNSPKRIMPFIVPQQNYQAQQQISSNNYPHQRLRPNEQSIGSNCSTLRATNDDDSKVPKTYISNPGHIPADTMYTNRANLHQTMLLQQKLFRQALLQQNQQVNTQIRTHFTAPNLSQYYFVSSQEVATVASKPSDTDVKMEWKVKRRQDGTRYIVRRPTRNRILRDRAMKISEERNECTTEDDTISEIKTGRYWTKEERKKHIERARERRHRQQLVILNKTNNFQFSSSPVYNINSIGSGGGDGVLSGNNVAGCTGLSSTPNRTAIINISQQQQPSQSQQLQQQTFQVISSKPPRQSSTRNSLTSQQQQQQQHQEPPSSSTLHKKILKKKNNKDESTDGGGNKQISGNSTNNNSKMTGLLSVTTV